MKSRALLIGLLAAGASAGVHAQEPGMYGGAGAGMYFMDVNELDFDESAMAARLFGGYRFNEYFSVEAGFQKLFESSGDVYVEEFDVTLDTEFDGTAWDLTLRPTLPVSDSFTAFAVLGLTSIDADIKGSAGGVSESVNVEDEELHYGVGGEFVLNDAWRLRGEWVMLDVSGGDFSTLSLSAVYNFR